MRKFQIENTMSGHVFGIYEGRNDGEALDAYAADAGYPDFLAACNVAPVLENEIVAREIFPPMTPERFDQCLTAIGWSALQLATACGRHRNTGNVWRAGTVAIPRDVEQWLEDAAAWHLRNKPPTVDGITFQPPCPITVRLRRPAAHIVEYHSTKHHDDGDVTDVFHCNREATFFGEWTGNPARQFSGAASTLWRKDDVALIAACKRRWRGHDVEFILEGKQGA